MTLDPAYLEYPRRRHGMDHDAYPWTSVFDRPPVAWPGGKPIVSVPVNHELSDRQIIGVQQQSAESYAQQIRDARC